MANIKSKSIKGILEEVCEHTERSGVKDYLHGKGDDEATEALVGFRVVGVKTATCVLMFCELSFPFFLLVSFFK